MSYPIVHINSYPGVGKLTIARKLVEMLRSFNGKLVHDLLLINPARAVLSRASDDFETLQRAMRTAILNTLTTSKDTFDSVFVFTDFLYNDDLGRSVMAECRDTAMHRNCTFVPILLTCSDEENLDRLVTTERSSLGKLTDPRLLPYLWGHDEIHPLPDDTLGMELDVTTLDADAAARLIFTHVLDDCVELNSRSRRLNQQ